MKESVKQPVVIVDDLAYAEQNCFLHQLILSIKRIQPSTQVIEFRKIRNPLNSRRYSKIVEEAGHLIILMRQRIINQEFTRLKSFVGDKKVVVYDQDPWNAYWDEYSTRGLYTKFGLELNFDFIATPSKWWCDYIEKKESIGVRFVRMGMLPEYCQVGPEIESRSVSLGFKGSLYPHRQEFFRWLASIGKDVEVSLGNLKYHEFLAFLRNVAIFIHDESSPLSCGGELIPRSAGMWHKDIEVSSQGTFVIRDHHAESESYDVNSIPLIRTYSDRSQIPGIIDEIAQLSLPDVRLMQKLSVARIQERNDWDTTARILLKMK
jgi:hypothetical protein